MPCSPGADSRQVTPRTDRLLWLPSVTFHPASYLEKSAFDCFLMAGPFRDIVESPCCVGESR
jgi:hypothetical protein